MIIAKNHSEGYFAPIIFKERNFTQVLNAIKTVSGRKYIRSEHRYIIPIMNLDEFKTIMDKKKIMYAVHDEVEQEFFRYREWYKEQLSIKKNINGNFKNDIILREGKELYPFQQSGVRFMTNSQNVINADVVGLGKTVQAIATAEYFLQQDKINYVLVICQASLRDQWGGKKDSTAGIEAFSYNKAIVIEGTKKERNKKYHSIINKDDLETKYIVMSYATLVAESKNDSDFDKLLKFLSENKFYLVLDEVQYIKGYSSKRSAEVAKIVQYDGLRGVCGLSATPVELNLDELFNEFKVLEPKVFGETFGNFADKYLEFDFWGEISAQKNTDVVKKKIAPYITRRRKEEVSSQLPKLVYKNYWIDLSKKQRKIYNDIKNNLVNDLIKDEEKKEQIEEAEILHQIILARQVCLSTNLVGTEENNSSKLTELLHFIRNQTEENDKIVIFCFFTKMVELINETLNQNGIKSLYIHGKSPKPDKNVGRNRDKIVKKFSEENYRVLVASDVLSQGYDKLKVASILINFDVRWNPAKMEQRTGRIDRLGQQSNSITVVNLISKDTIESKRMYEILEKRKRLFNDIIDDNFKYKRITKETIKDIL